MRSFNSVLSVSALLTHGAFAAALLSSEDGLFAAVDDALRPLEGIEALLDPITGTIASLVPLELFPSFKALTLDEVVKHPELLNQTLNAHYDSEPSSTSAEPSSASEEPSSTSAEGESEFAKPNVKQASSTPSAAATCTSPGTRIEWRSYSDSDRNAFVEAIVCLTELPSAGSSFYPSTSRFEDFAMAHQKLTPDIHSNGIFLFWHRYYLHAFEQELREKCQFTRAMPWWDETKDSGRFRQAPLFTPNYFGTLSGATRGHGTCVTDGKFANLTVHIGPGTENYAHCLSRAVDETMTAQASTPYVDFCAEETTTGGFSHCAEGGPHAWGHNGIGSVMADVYSSPSDPIFFMHHLFVDNTLASWQQRSNSRKQTIVNACTDESDPCRTPVTLSTVLDMGGLRPNARVGDVINTQAGLLCYRYDYYL